MHMMNAIHSGLLMVDNKISRAIVTVYGVVTMMGNALHGTNGSL